MQAGSATPPSGSSEAALSDEACTPRVVVGSRRQWLLYDVGDGGRRRSSEPTTPQRDDDGCAPMAERQGGGEGARVVALNLKI